MRQRFSPFERRNDQRGERAGRGKYIGGILPDCSMSQDTIHGGDHSHLDNQVQGATKGNRYIPCLQDTKLLTTFISCMVPAKSTARQRNNEPLLNTIYPPRTLKLTQMTSRVLSASPLSSRFS